MPHVHRPPPTALHPASGGLSHRLRRVASTALLCALVGAAAGPVRAQSDPAAGPVRAQSEAGDAPVRAQPEAGAGATPEPTPAPLSSPATGLLEPGADAASPPPPDEVLAADAAAAVGASPEVDPSTEAAARERQDVLDESRATLEAIEEKAPEALSVSDLPEPCSGPWDWVHLSSGEWLRGEFKRMRKKKFEFQSTRMKSQNIDWKHIKEFCFASETRFILYDHTVLVGHGRLSNGRLTVTRGDVTQTATRDDIWSMLPGLPKELNRWSASLSAGLDAYAGNTDQQNLTASVALDRDDPSTHLDLDYTTSFGATSGVQNVKRHRATAEYDVYFNRALFAVLPGVQYTSDTFQNLQQRVAPGIGLGYEIFDLDTLEWDVQLGVAYQYTQYVSVAPGQHQRENDVGPLLLTNLDWDITGDLTFKLSQNAVLLTIDFDQSNFHTQGSLVYDVTDFIYLEFSAWYDRVLHPRPKADGSIPDANDVRTVVSIGLKFE